MANLWHTCQKWHIDQIITKRKNTFNSFYNLAFNENKNKSGNNSILFLKNIVVNYKNEKHTTSRRNVLYFETRRVAQRKNCI